MTKTNNVVTTPMRSFHDGTTYRLWNECQCGCRKVVRNRFAQGHDMKVQKENR